MGDEWEDEDEWDEAAKAGDDEGESPSPDRPTPAMLQSPEAAAGGEKAGAEKADAGSVAGRSQGTEESWTKMSSTPDLHDSAGPSTAGPSTPSGPGRAAADEGTRVHVEEVHSLKDLGMKGQNDVVKLAQLVGAKLNDATAKDAWQKGLQGIYGKSLSSLTLQDAERLNTLISTMAKSKKRKELEEETERKKEAARKEEEDKKKKLEEDGEVDDETFYAALLAAEG